MNPLRRILLPTDFSSSAGQALRYAVGIAEQCAAELHLLHVVSEVLPSVGPAKSSGVPPDRAKELMETAERQMAGLLSGHDVKVPVKVSAIVGSPAHEIVQYAKNHQIDVIVMGRHGHSALAHLLLGSVTDTVLRKANCPVLLVHNVEQGVLR